MKIAYIIPSLRNTAPMKIVRSLVRHLTHRAEIDLFYFKEAEGQSRLAFDVPPQKLSFLNSIDFEGYNIIHSHGVLPDLYVRYHRGKIKKAKCVTTLHNIAHEDFAFHYGALKASLMLRLWRFALTSFDMTVVLSEYAKAHYRRRWGIERLAVIHNGIAKSVDTDVVEDETITALKKRYRLIFSAGKLSRLKGFEQLLKALPKLPGMALVVAGEGEERTSLAHLAKHMEVEDRVYFMGFREDTASLMAVCDLVCVPSRSEGFGLVVLEAMRAKKPIILSDIPVFRELFDMPRFRLDDSNDLVTKISSIQESEGERNYRLFLKKFTDEIMVQKYENLYKELRRA